MSLAMTMVSQFGMKVQPRPPQLHNRERQLGVICVGTTLGASQLLLESGRSWNDVKAE
jgi:hypothetical protein